MARLLTVGDIADLLGGISRQRVDQLAKRPDFPKPVQTTRSARLWDENDINDWIKEHRPDRAR